MQRELPTGIPELMELLEQEILAIVVVPTWNDEGIGPRKIARTKMALGRLNKIHLTPNFIDVNLAGTPGTYGKVVYGSDDKSNFVADLISEKLGVLKGSNQKFDWDRCNNWDMAYAMTQLLKFSDVHSRFLFLVSDKTEPLLEMLRIIFRDMPKRKGFTATAGECFVLYPETRLITTVKLPGEKF